MPFSTKWFLVYYVILGLLLIISGGFLITKPDRIKKWLSAKAQHEQPPSLLIRILKYAILFTLPGLVLSFFPFSWIELLFCIWYLMLLFMASLQLVRWQQTRILIQEKSQTLFEIIRKSGAITLSVGLAILLLAYLVVKRSL